MKRFSIAFCVCLSASTAFGTAQFSERLLYKGKICGLTVLPLEEYFDANHPRPKELRATSTGCYRGYVGTWEVKDRTLYLISLGRFRGSRRPMEEIPLSLIFEDRKAPIKADWYTGVLRVRQGKLLRYVHMRFDSVYEKDLYIVVKRGIIISELLVDNKREGATRSTSDWQWVALGSKPVKDDFKWHDARIILSDVFDKLRESGKSFRTRGIYFKGGGAVASRLRIPSTPTTRAITIPLESVPENREGKAVERVEITAHFAKESGDYSLHVDSIRPLKPGETMHHRDFKPPEKPAENQR